MFLKVLCIGSALIFQDIHSVNLLGFVIVLNSLSDLTIKRSVGELVLLAINTNYDVVIVCYSIFPCEFYD